MQSQKRHDRVIVSSLKIANTRYHALSLHKSDKSENGVMLPYMGWCFQILSGNTRHSSQAFTWTWVDWIILHLIILITQTKSCQTFTTESLLLRQMFGQVSFLSSTSSGLHSWAPYTVFTVEKTYTFQSGTSDKKQVPLSLSYRSDTLWSEFQKEWFLNISTILVSFIAATTDTYPTRPYTSLISHSSLL